MKLKLIIIIILLSFSSANAQFISNNTESGNILSNWTSYTSVIHKKEDTLNQIIKEQDVKIDTLNGIISILEEDNKYKEKKVKNITIENVILKIIITIFVGISIYNLSGK